MTTTRVGLGFDVHAFGGDGPLVLGGVTFEGQGLVAHSDGDVVAHAVADALLGAAALPDLGTMFPDDDPRFADASSIRLLAEVRGALDAAGWRVGNVDVVVACERPRLGGHVRRMAENVGRAIGAGVDDVAVKPKSPEGLGAIGRAEGIAAWAVALVSSLDDG